MELPAVLGDYGRRGSVEGKVLVLLYKPKGYLYRRTDTQLDCKGQSKEACGGWQTSRLSFRRAQWRKLSGTTFDTDNSGWNKLASLQKRFLYAMSASQYTCRIPEPFIYPVPHTVHALEVNGSCHHPRHALPASKKNIYMNKQDEHLNYVTWMSGLENIRHDLSYHSPSFSLSS